LSDNPAPRTLVLALGNDVLGDDAVGFHAARLLREEMGGRVDVVASHEAGLALIDFLEGYDRALILDAIVTLKCPPGTVLEFGPADFQGMRSTSPHFAGLPEILRLAEAVVKPFPSEVRVLAMEIKNPDHFREDLSETVLQALPEFVSQARRILEGWGSPVPCTSTP
jgi:hydrogenase maturation protease